MRSSTGEGSFVRSYTVLMGGNVPEREDCESYLFC